uniref:Uncharacterized protein n=1 Tax=Chenopodium quinoa TaxID=63459 RepID=A0A803MBG2_CHEQI
MIACLFIRSKSPRPFHALLLRGVPWAKTFFYTSSRAAFTAIITTFFRGHGMTLFLVLFNRCLVPPFPARESPSALSGRAIALPYVRCKAWSPISVLGRWGFLFFNQFGCESSEIGLTFSYELAGQRWIESKTDSFDFRSGEYHSINNKTKVAIQFQFELRSNLLSIDRREQTAIACLLYYGRLGDIGERPGEE